MKNRDSLGKGAFSHLSPYKMFSQEPIAWPDKIEILIDDLENEAISRDLGREERALMDVYETVPILESRDCLHEFWQSSIDHQRVISSFDLIGASTIVDALNASRWCQTHKQDREDYSETETDYLATIEEELPAGMDELVDLVLEFIADELR
jgi:predicted Zn-dependent protease with MMP-like domain